MQYNPNSPIWLQVMTALQTRRPARTTPLDGPHDSKKRAECQAPRETGGADVRTCRSAERDCPPSVP